jgi:hypothetical protein
MSFLGAITSHGPSRESYTSGRKSSASTAEATGPATAHPTVSAQGMRAPFSSPASSPALLQRAVPDSGAGVVALEGAAKIPRHGGRERKTQRAKLPVPRARPKAQATTAGTSGCRAGEGNHSRVFSTLVATAPAAMKSSAANRDRHCRDSAPTSAGTPWNAFGSGSGVGGNPDSEPAPDELEIVPTY